MLAPTFATQQTGGNENEMGSENRVLTWKMGDDGTRPPKARCVVLGYQDPHYESRQTMAPTMSRTTRQVLLGLATALKMRVSKGDVSGAFLQGREYQHDAYVIPTDEICAACGIPVGSVTKLIRRHAIRISGCPVRMVLNGV